MTARNLPNAFTVRDVTFSTHGLSHGNRPIFAHKQQLFTKLHYPAGFRNTGVVFSVTDFSSTGSYKLANGFDAFYYLLRIHTKYFFTRIWSAGIQASFLHTCKIIIFPLVYRGTSKTENCNDGRPE